MPTPTIGRVVHFHRDLGANGLLPEAAIVSGVNPNGTVNLAVFSALEGDSLPVRRERNVSSGGPGADLSTLGCWTWPPRG